MTLLVPQLFYFIIKTSLTAMNAINYTVNYMEQDVPNEVFGWLGYIFIPYITAILQGSIAFICGVLSVPLYFWNLLRHPNGRSILDMLRNPEGHGQFISSTTNPCCRQYREQPRPVPQWVWRCKPSHLRFRWSSISPDEIPLCGYDSRLHMYSYYWIHPSSITKTKGGSSSEDGVTADVKSNTVTWHSQITSTLLSGIKIF